MKNPLNIALPWLITLLLWLLPNPLLKAQDQNGFADRIHALHDRLIEEGKTTQQLSESDLANFPIGITKNVAGFQYLVIIDSARFTSTGAFFDAYVSLQFKSDGKRIAFAARNIAFHRGGISSSNEVKLALVSEETLTFGKNIQLVLPAFREQNYVAIDCNGFKSVNLQGKIKFDRELLIPEDDNGEALAGQVETDFNINSTDWNALLVSVSLPTFRLPSLQGINFKANEVALDMSDVQNPAGMKFPGQYQQQYGANLQLWEGFYIRKARVGLFKELSQGGKRRYIDVEHFIIDKQGVSGGIGVSKLFNREEGSLNGWPFSVDSLGIVLVKNKVSGAGFKGEMNIPLLSRDHPLSYSAFVTQESGETQYTFALQPGKHLKASVLVADLDLAPSSTIIISKKNGKLLPEAILHGTMSVNAGAGVQLKQISFTDLHLASEKPYIRNGYWSLSGGKDNTAANFPVSIDSITFRHTAQDLRLDVSVMLGLMNESDKGFSAKSVVSITGEIVDAETTTQGDGTVAVSPQEWKHKDTRISDIDINADMEAFALKGKLSLYEKDVVYGRGFRGEMDASFKAGPSVKAIAQFGHVDDYRYWYADALMSLGNTSASPGFAVYGFGGGVYYHMALEQKAIASSGFKTVQGASDRYSIGATRSGSRYVPDKSVSLGMKATVKVGTAPSPRPFNGDATFEMAFNKKMGLKYIRIRGEGYFLTELDKRDNPPMYADLNINYDFDQDELNAFLDMYVDAYDVIKGVNAENHAGSAVMHFGKDKWYIWIGSPSQRIGVNIMGLAEARAYLMIGDEIESMPAPLEGIQVTSENLQKVLAELKSNAARTGAEASTGKGFIFGASFSTAIGKDDPGAVFYGFFQASAGFDVMLQDMGAMTCKGRSGPVGINGWYASGQVWAHLQGAVGINVNLKFIKGKFEAFRFLAAIVMQAEMPNPTWVQGTALGHFNILNGLVKGDCQFQVSIGERCEFDNQAPIAMEVIADMQPAPGNSGVDVFTIPQVAFNIAVETPIEMLNAAEQHESYQIKLKSFKVLDDKTEIKGSLSWNEDKTVLAFTSDEILPPQKNLKAKVLIQWQQLINNSWKDLNATESREVSFTTGEAPNYIPENNIAYSYPVRNQYAFLKREHNTGYIQLKQGQSYLFSPTDEKGRSWEYIARFGKTGGASYHDEKLTYKDKTVTYAVPQKLDNETVYQLGILKKPLTTLNIDENMVKVESNIKLAQASDVSTTQKGLKSSLIAADIETLFSYAMRTSRYNTFSEKVNAMTGQQTISGTVQDIHIFKLGVRLTMPEVFDETELKGTYGQKSLITAYAKLDNNAWFKDSINALLYQYYPVHDQVKIDWRTTTTAGVPPIYSIVNELSVSAPSLSTDQKAAGSAVGIQGDIYFHYQLPIYTYKDHFNLRPKAISKYTGVLASSIPTGAKNLMYKRYTNFLDGNYEFVIAYRLPGTYQVTSSKTLSIQW